MKNSYKSYIKGFLFGTMISLCFLGVSMLMAWTSPTGNPPENNVLAPINISSQGQIKQGGLMLNTADADVGFVVANGNVGIGVETPSVELDVKGNIQATGDICITPVICLSQLVPIMANQPLVNNQHTYGACTDANGEVIDSDVSYPMCRFNLSSCPTGWTQYKNFNASRSNTCSICSSCTTGGNSWENRSFSCLSCSDCRPQTYVSSNTPCCHYFGYNSQISWATWCGGRSNSHVCTAIKTQIGCY